jgi:hypothetical protein
MNHHIGTVDGADHTFHVIEVSRDRLDSMLLEVIATTRFPDQRPDPRRSADHRLDDVGPNKAGRAGQQHRFNRQSASKLTPYPSNANGIPARLAQGQRFFGQIS